MLHVVNQLHKLKLKRSNLASKILLHIIMYISLER